MPSVLFFTQGVSVPSSRFRAQQIVPGLRKMGIECTLMPCRPSTHGDVELAWVHGARRSLFRPMTLITRPLQMRHVPQHDVVFLQRPLLKYYTTLLERFVTRARPTIFDFDDAIFHNHAGLDRFRVRKIVAWASHIVVGNRYLYEFVDRPDKTTIIPTVVDTERYTPRADPNGRFTVAWTGLSSNLREMRPIIGALRKALRETRGRLLVVADRPPKGGFGDLPLEFIPWSPSSEVSALAKAHVGIMPLRDTAYNRGKCGFKLIQYMARGIPVVATPIGANAEILRHGEEGFFARSDQGWVDAIVGLARSPDRRSLLGARGRSRVQAHYSLKAVLPRYNDIIRSIIRE